MRVLVTGSKGFIGKNLCVGLRELGRHEVVEATRENLSHYLSNLSEVDFVFHLAGVNRPKEDSEFVSGNVDITRALCQAVKDSKKDIPLVLSSSIHAVKDSPYGVSKKAAEEHVIDLQLGIVYRLPNVFGKWSRPNYNSAVATFCHNIARDLPIEIYDRSAKVSLVYIDDVVREFLGVLQSFESQSLNKNPGRAVYPVFESTVGELADQILAFKESRNTLITEATGSGFVRALHATYLSFLEPEKFSYTLPCYGDQRGVFVEMLKTKDSGQFSFFTAHPGITRGGHYHHSKTEKFLVLKGKAKYKFRNIVTDERYEIIVDSSNESVVVETIPGWSHDITNIGDTELVVMLWANEIFNRSAPDTIPYGV